MELTEARKPFGGFTTEVMGGRGVSLHVPSGQCVQWLSKEWARENIYEKMLLTVPGTLGPLRR